MAEEKKTFDEILEDADYKAEFDRRVTKALSTVQRKLDAETDKNRKLTEKYGADGDGDDIETLREQVRTLRDDLNSRDYDAAIARAIDAADGGKGLRFTSKSAREAFEAAVRAGKLELKDGELEGFADIVEARKKADPDAFRADEPEKSDKPEQPAKPPARFTGKMDHADGSGGMSRADIAKITDRAERRAAIAANLETFKGE